MIDGPATATTITATRTMCVYIDIACSRAIVIPYRSPSISTYLRPCFISSSSDRTVTPLSFFVKELKIWWCDLVRLKALKTRSRVHCTYEKGINSITIRLHANHTNLSHCIQCFPNASVVCFVIFKIFRCAMCN